MAILASKDRKPALKKVPKREREINLPQSQRMDKVVGEGRHVGEGSLKWIPVERISPDPDQPRTELHDAGITKNTVLAHVAGSVDLSKSPDAADHFADLQGLAASIKSVGLLNPISVYENDDSMDEQYYIGEGERRYLATLLNESKTIRAIVKQAPSQLLLRASQLVENINRVDLSANDRAQSLLKLNQLHLAEHNKPLASDDLESILGVSPRQARTYVSIVQAPADVHQALKDKKITSLDKASRIAQIKSQPEREEAVEKLTLGLSPVQAQPKSKPAAKQKKGKGRPVQKVSLGSTKDVAVVKKIMCSVLGDSVWKSVSRKTDWSDFAAVNSAWKNFINELEG